MSDPPPTSHQPETLRELFWWLHGWTWATSTAQEYGLPAAGADQVRAHGHRLADGVRARIAP